MFLRHNDAKWPGGTHGTFRPFTIVFTNLNASLMIPLDQGWYYCCTTAMRERFIYPGFCCELISTLLHHPSCPQHCLRIWLWPLHTTPYLNCRWIRSATLIEPLSSISTRMVLITLHSHTYSLHPNLQIDVLFIKTLWTSSTAVFVTFFVWFEMLLMLVLNQSMVKKFFTLSWPNQIVCCFAFFPCTIVINRWVLRGDPWWLQWNPVHIDLLKE